MYHPNRETIATIDTLLRGLRHELSSTATVLLLAIEQLDLAAAQGDTDLREKLRELHGDLAQLSRLIIRLRQYPENSVEGVPVNLVAIVDEAIAQLKPMASRLGIAIDAQLPSTSQWANGSEQSVMHAFRGLIENALEATAAFESIEPVEISMRIENRLITLVVADRGPGFTANVVHEGILIRPGYTTKREDGTARGLGMGLLVAQAVSELWGGTLRLQNRAKGGALAIMTLPMSPANPVQSPSDKE